MGGLGNTPLEGILEKKFQAKVVCIHFPSTYQKKNNYKSPKEKKFFFPLVPYAYSLCNDDSNYNKKSENLVGGGSFD